MDSNMTFTKIIPGLLKGKKYTYSKDGFWWIQFGEEDDLGGQLLEIRNAENNECLYHFWAHWLEQNNWRELT
jgi:hypothetical protein